MSEERLDHVRKEVKRWLLDGMSEREILDRLADEVPSAADAVTVVWAELSLPMDEARDRVANHPAWRWEVLGSHDSLFDTVNMRDETIEAMVRETDDMKRTDN